MFIPLESVNLFIYAIDNLIIPFRYSKYGDDRESIQNRYPNHILMSKNRWVRNCNMSLEVEILEKDLIKLDDNFYLYPLAVTFTNLKNIFFKTEKQMKITVTNLEISTTILPKQLISFDNSKILEIEFISTKNIRKPKNIATQIKLFRKYLGGLAISEKVTNNKIDLSINRYFTDIKYRKIEKILLENDNITEELLENFAKNAKIKLVKKITGFYDIKSLPKESLTFILAVLEKYRYKMSDNLEGLIIEISHLDKTLQNNILILYGLMLGYSRLPFLGINTKFRFDKKSDFDILETIYRKAFKEKIKKVDRLEQLKTDIFEKNFDELLEKFGVSETTLKPNIRQTILEFDISVSEKIELFEKFGLRVSKNLSILKLKEILKNGKFTSKELAEKLKVSLNTIRNYLKEISLQI